MPDAIILLSGGLDSATVLALAMEQGFTPLPLTFDYGQRHAIELAAAGAVCASLGAPPPKVLKLDLRAIGGSALTADIDVPKDAPGGDIPVTYVPARNTLFLSYALAYAEAVGAHDIFIGVNAVDYSGYPDCRPEFIAAFEKLANLATREGVEGRAIRIHAPLINLTKAEIIQRGHKLGVDYALTRSCYDPVGDLACGRCDSCRLRRAGFDAAQINDPTRYVV
jgi:7-cyano-7-deazaguanine synthase